MKSFCYSLATALIVMTAVGSETLAQKFSERQGPENVRGVVTELDAESLVLKTREGDVVRILVPEEITVIALDKGRFQEIDFGVYVGSVAKKLNEYSPIVRDSLSWLHRGYEFRVIDEQLRGIALGHQKWDLTKESVMAHGWIDDIEGRVFSVKYGPTEEEETDVEVPRDLQVLYMSLGDKSLIQVGKKIVVGAQKNEDGDYVGQFVFAGKNGFSPGL